MKLQSFRSKHPKRQDLFTQLPYEIYLLILQECQNEGVLLSISQLNKHMRRLFLDKVFEHVKIPFVLDAKSRNFKTARTFALEHQGWIRRPSNNLPTHVRQLVKGLSVDIFSAPHVSNNCKEVHARWFQYYNHKFTHSKNGAREFLETLEKFLENSQDQIQHLTINVICRLADSKYAFELLAKSKLGMDLPELKTFRVIIPRIFSLHHIPQDCLSLFSKVMERDTLTQIFTPHFNDTMARLPNLKLSCHLRRLTLNILPYFDVDRSDGILWPSTLEILELDLDGHAFGVANSRLPFLHDVLFNSRKTLREFSLIHGKIHQPLYEEKFGRKTGDSLVEFFVLERLRFQLIIDGIGFTKALFQPFKLAKIKWVTLEYGMKYDSSEEIVDDDLDFEKFREIVKERLGELPNIEIVQIQSNFWDGYEKIKAFEEPKDSIRQRWFTSRKSKLRRLVHNDIAPSGWRKRL